MEEKAKGPSPARLYAAAVGAVLFAIGIAGFFYSASFGSPGEVEEAFGFLAVNGWANVLHLLCGAMGLLVAGYAARAYALWLGVGYTALAVWGFVLGDGEAILGLLPVNGGENFLHLALGILGILAARATPQAKPQRSGDPDRGPASSRRPVKQPS